ncbi:hypothetical protein BDV19DRAFT_327509 [Aspergillus venezuelensis]
MAARAILPQSPTPTIQAFCPVLTCSSSSPPLSLHQRRCQLPVDSLSSPLSSSLPSPPFSPLHSVLISASTSLLLLFLRCVLFNRAVPSSISRCI